MTCPSISFFLEDDDPQESYYEGFYKGTNVTLSPYWGQRKLLMTELFLLLNYTNYDHLVYAGAAPGNHIPYLANIFPEITFHLFDPKDMSIPPWPNTIFYKELFTDEWAYRFRTVSDQCIFVSDIRNTKYNREEDVETMNNIVIEDMELQRKWVEIIRPRVFMLKFRLPFPAEILSEGTSKKYQERTVQYLDGKILKQPYIGPASSETRLIGTEIKYRDYSIVKYQDQMFYHNKNIRLGHFSNPISGDEPLWPPELLNDYDSTFEIYVIMQLLDRLGKEITKANIIEISQDVTDSLNNNDVQIKFHKSLSSMRNTTNKKYKEDKKDINELK
jgi:hypothetical protein